MPEHKIGSSHSFTNLMRAYQADAQGDDDAHFLLYRGEEILALCLRYKYNRNPNEVWVGDEKEVTRRGEALADLKGKKTVPVYYSPKNRQLYEYRGHHLITGDTTDAEELQQRNAPVGLSRVVFLKPVDHSHSSTSPR